MNKFSFEPQPTICPKCGESNIIVHTLESGKIGI